MIDSITSKCLSGSLFYTCYAALDSLVINITDNAMHFLIFIQFPSTHIPDRNYELKAMVIFSN